MPAVDMPPAEMDPDVLSGEPGNTEFVTPGKVLQEHCCAIRVCYSTWGSTRALDKEQKSTAAGALDTTIEGLSASKRLFSTKVKPVADLLKIIRHAKEYVDWNTKPYIEAGIRLVSRERLADMDEALKLFRAQLRSATQNLNEHMDEVRKEARERLKSIYRDSDYDLDATAMFDIHWDYPSIEPPSYLEALAPEVYAREVARLQGKLQEAAAFIESDFADGFLQLAKHVTERLSGDIVAKKSGVATVERDQDRDTLIITVDGLRHSGSSEADALVHTGDTVEEGQLLARDPKPKVFRESMAEHLVQQLQYFRTQLLPLGLTSDGKLDDALAKVQSLVKSAGTTRSLLSELKGSVTFRTQMKSTMESLSSTLDQILVDKPRRKIRRIATDIDD